MEIRYWILLTFLGALWGSAFMFIKVATPEFPAFGGWLTFTVIAGFVTDAGHPELSDRFKTE